MQEASVFDPSAPDGDYELDMSNPCAVLFMLMLLMLMLLMPMVMMYVCCSWCG